jgi:glycosyltransferase involved in cell wall biosynthesis
VGDVLFWAAGNDGSSWYRCTQPAEALQWQGHRATVTEAITEFDVRRADTIVASRVANEVSHGLWLDLAARPREYRPRLVLDLDDDYFSIDRSNPAYSGWDAMSLFRLKESILAADLVTVASRGLAEAIQAHTGGHAKVQVVENGLHAGWLAQPRDYEAANRPLIVGWAGTPSTITDFDLAAPALANIVNYGKGKVEVRLVGFQDGHPSVETMRRKINVQHLGLVQGVPWVPHGEPYLGAVSEFDIWVAPYRPTPFVEAKFPTKALEAGVMGIPLIASAIRPYRDWIIQDSSGFKVVDSAPWMWGRCLKRLVDSADLRQSIGEAGRSRAARNIMQSLGIQWAQVCQLKEAQ